MNKPPRDYDLSLEESVVWVDDPRRHGYVRQKVWSYAGTRVRGASVPYRGYRSIGYTTLGPDVKPWNSSPRWFHRRVFFVTPWDRSSDPHGVYRRHCPYEAVDPLSVTPGVWGDKNERAWGCLCAEGNSGTAFEPSQWCHMCHDCRLVQLRSEVVAL